MKSVFVLALFLDALGCLGQIRVSKDSVAIWSWEDVTIDRARTLFGEVPKEQSTQLGHAKLVSGVCVPIEGPYILDFEESGVTMQFTPLDSLGQGKLKSMLVRKAGKVRTPLEVDIGQLLVSEPNSDGSAFKVVDAGGREYLEQFRDGVLYYCRPASIVKARKGKPLKVEWFRVFDYY